MSSIWTAISASVRGNWHEQSGQKNQDAVRLKNPRTAADALLIAVSDGHGSMRSFRSDRGSVLAAECALRLLKNFARRTGPSVPLSRVRRQAQQRWPQELVAAWRRAVRADLIRDPFSPIDFAAFPESPPVIKPGAEPPRIAYLAYGATLIVVAVTRRYILYAQLGDGDILTVGGDGKVSRPLKRHHKFYANETASLCTSEALSEFQVRVDPVRAGRPALIMLSTDGYANCFGNDEGFFSVGADLLAYTRRHGAVFVDENLAKWLRDSSRDGSGDDITVGLAVRAMGRTG
ncbi:MAG: protein phosphatase 2C domain-containing protein [Methylacidiphilales bacterium]|nr:protein phosphatase 2C domain-containing protein [Candidatus Methylacidiphilales bacterium]